MADDDAVQKLTIDASGAKQGAFEFIQAGNQVIAANQAVVASETKAADAINAAATRSSAARRNKAQAARDAAALEIAAAAAGGDAVVTATDRIVVSTSKQIAAINRVAQSFDPMLAAAARAQRQLETLMDISAQGGPQGLRADALMPEAVGRLNTAQANLSFGGDVGSAVDQLTAKFAPAQASAQRMTAELAQLNQALELGVGIEGGYAAAWDAIVAKYDLGAQAAARARDALSGIAAALDPTIAAVARAGQQLEMLRGLTPLGGATGAQALALMPQATAQLTAAQANQAFAAAAMGGQSAAQPSDALDRAAVSADGLKLRFAVLKATLADGVTNVGQYAGAWDRVSGSMEAYIAAARQASAVTVEQVVQARMAQDTVNSQAQVNRFAGVKTSPGSIGGREQSPYSSAASSGQAFMDAGFVGDPVALRSSIDSQFAVSKQYEAQYETIIGLRKTMELTEAQEGAAIDRLNAAYKALLETLDTSGATLSVIAGSFDPLTAAVRRARQQIEALRAIPPGGPQGVQAAALMPQAQAQLKAAEANRAFGVAAASGPAEFAPLSGAMAEAGLSVDLLRSRMAELRATLIDGIGNAGQYAGAWDRVSGSLDEYVAAAQRANAVTAEQIVQARMAQDAINSQAAVNQFAGVKTSPGTVGGRAYNPNSTAEQSGQAFIDAGFTPDPDAQRASVDSLFAVSKQYAAQYDTINNLRKTGVYNEQQESAAIDRLNASYKTQIDGMNKSAGAAHGLAGANAGVTRELIVMGHEVLMGNFSRLGGSMLVITEYIDDLGGTIRKVLAFLATPVGIAGLLGAATVTAVTALAVAAENAALRVERLQNALALVRPDFAAAAHGAEQAARALAETSFLKTADARTGTQTIYANSSFTGTPGQAQQIAAAFALLSRSLSENETDWKRLGEALNNPAATLQTLLDQNHLVGINQALVNQAKLLQESGDRAGAFGLVLRVVQDATSGTMGRMTPLETALHDLSLAFTKTGHDGHDFAENLGTPITNTIAVVVASLAALITQLRKLGEQYPITMSIIAGAIKALPGGLIPGYFLEGTVPKSDKNALPPGTMPTTSYGGVAGGVQTTGAALATAGGTSYNVDVAAAIVADLVTKGIPQLDAVALAAQSIAETGGNFTGPRAVGDLNIPAGIDPTYGAYPGGSHGAYQWNRGRLANFMGQNQGLLPEQTSMSTQNAFVAYELAHDYQRMYAAAQTAPDLATKTAIYTGKYEVPADIQGQVASRTAVALDLQKRLSTGGVVAPPASGVVNPEGGPTSGFAAGTGVTNPVNKTLDDAQKMADSMGTTAAAAETADARVKAFTAALKLDPGNVEFQQALQQANLELYKAVPAADAALRAIDLQTRGEDRMAVAWGKGATAAAETTNQIKAEAEATQFASPYTDEWNAAVIALAGSLDRQAAATQGAAQAQQALLDRNTIAYTQKEIDTLGMEAGARTAVLSALKAQQDAEQKYAQNPAAQQAAEADAAAISKLTFALQQNDAALSAVASGFSSSFDTIGNAMTQSFLSGQGAAVNWANVMTSAAQQVLQQFLKLAVINPLLNSLGLGGPNGLPTLDTVGAAINQQATNGTGIGGMLSGTWLGNLLGVKAASDAASAAAGSPSLTANDLAFGAGAAADLSQIPLPPIPASVGHVGWQVGASAPTTRFVHPAYFDDAPRYHGGMPSLAGDEFPAILQRGERVITAKQDDRLLDVIGKLATHAQDARGIPVTPLPAGQRDPFLPMLAHAESVANALPRGSVTGAHLFHSGGIVGQAAALAPVLSSALINAPRLHDGGVGGVISAAIGGLTTGESSGPTANGSRSIGSAGSSAAAPFAYLEPFAATEPLAAALTRIPAAGGTSASPAAFLDAFLDRRTTTSHVFHRGGVVGASAMSATYPAALFADAPRFHDGTTDDDKQFSGAPGVPSAYDKLKALVGPNVVPLPSGGFAIVGAPGGYPGDSGSAAGAVLSSLGPAALPLAMLLMKSGSLFSGSGLLSANSLNSAFGTTLGAGTFPSAANPWAIPAGYASDTFTPLPGAIAGVVPEAAGASAGASAAEAAAGSGSFLDSIASWWSALWVHQGGAIGSGAIPGRAVPSLWYAAAPRLHEGLDRKPAEGMPAKTAADGPWAMPDRTVVADFVQTLPRFHDGLAADEFLTMLRPGHRVVTAAHQASMMQSADAMGVGSGLAAILRAAPSGAGTGSGAFPAILQHGERALGHDQQAAILALMGRGNMPGGISIDNPLAGAAMPSPAGYSDPIPRFHEGRGGQDLLDIVNRGDQAMADRQRGASDAAANSTLKEGHTINVTVQGAPGGSPDSYRRTGNQIARTVVTALSRAQSRDG